jgi:hypothetical protein
MAGVPGAENLAQTLLAEDIQPGHGAAVLLLEGRRRVIAMPPDNPCGTSNGEYGAFEGVLKF